MRTDRAWYPDAGRSRLDRVDLAAGHPGTRRHRGRRRIAPGADRGSRRRPRIAGACRRTPSDRRVRDRLRLLDAVDGPRPARRRHDRDARSRTAPGPTWRVAGGARPASPTSGSTVVNKPALAAFEEGDPALAGPVRLRLHRCPQARVRRLRRSGRGPAGARCAVRRRQRPVERSRVGRPARRAGRRATPTPSASSMPRC